MKRIGSGRGRMSMAMFLFTGLFLVCWNAGDTGNPVKASAGMEAGPSFWAKSTVEPETTPHEFGDMPDPDVQALIDRVTPTLVYSYVAGLSGEQPVAIGGNLYTIRDRNTWNQNYGNTGIQLVTQYAYERFSSFGLQTSYHVWNDSTNPNVIAEQTGTALPGSLYFLTAHLDNMPYIGPGASVAPGADDNASGSAGVLLAAEILSQAPCQRTLRYILFTGEEQGLLGSRAYAGEVAGEAIEGVLNLDMIGWDSGGDPGLDLYARDYYPDDFRIAALFARVIDAYDLNLVSELRGEYLTASDHAAFWERGFPAVLAIEDRDDFNDYYHTRADNLAHLNIGYMTNFVKASVGALAHLACLAPRPVFLPLIPDHSALFR